MRTRFLLNTAGRTGAALIHLLVLGVVLAVAAGCAAGPQRTTSRGHHPATTSVRAAPTNRPATPPPVPASTIATHAAPQASAPPPAPAPATTRITLHRGDTLWNLARRHHTTVTALQALNHLGTSTLILAGHTLLTPAGTTGPPQPQTANHQTSTPHPTGRVAAVLAYARAQLGKPYQWGAAGPNTFDCSGLTMRAWATAGVHLPHHAADQAHAGTHTTRAALQPGDLIITNNYGHVQLYLGAGHVIQAPHTGARVQISPLPPPATVNTYVHITSPTQGS